MLKHRLFVALGMATWAISCWPDAAAADPCHPPVVFPQQVPPKADDLQSTFTKLGMIAIEDFLFAKSIPLIDPKTGKPAIDPKTGKIGEIDFGQLAKIAQTVAELTGLIGGPPDIDTQFQTLEDQLAAIDAHISDDNNEAFKHIIAKQVADWHAEMKQALQDVQSYAVQNKTLPQDHPSAVSSGIAINGALEDFYWRRVFNLCNNNIDFSGWASVISPPAPTNDGGVNSSTYEWRYMVPYILTAIPNRIHVLTSIFPDWGGNKFAGADPYLESYAVDLSRHLSKMTDGVQCSSVTRGGTSGKPLILNIAAACADINTGLSQFKVFRLPLSPPPTPAQSKAFQAAIQTFLAVFRSLIIQNMPLFKMQSMVDSLHYYLRRAPDLTEVRQRIPLAAAHNLCLEDRGDNILVALATCGVGYTQDWLYDRATGQITNPNLGHCLTIQQNGVQPIPGTRVVSKACGDGDIYQEWTYDPTTQRLSNAFGTVLATDGAVPGQSVRLANFNDYASWSQRWFADPGASPLSSFPSSGSSTNF